jgi:hypothetical protein
MPVNTQDVVARLDDLIHEAEPDIQADSHSGAWYRVPTVKQREMRVRALSAIRRYAPPNGPHVADAESVLDKTQDGWIVPRLVGVLKALRADYANGDLHSIEGLVHVSVLADFMAMAAELLDSDYKDPSAVIVGGVLEQHLRAMAEKRDIEVERDSGKYKKADSLNAELAKAEAYGKLEQKNITAWLGLRNHAAHGEYDKYTKSQVDEMLAGVRSFIVRNPE